MKQHPQAKVQTTKEALAQQDKLFDFIQRLVEANEGSKPPTLVKSSSFATKSLADELRAKQASKYDDDDDRDEVAARKIASVLGSKPSTTQPKSTTKNNVVLSKTKKEPGKEKSKRPQQTPSKPLGPVDSIMDFGVNAVYYFDYDEPVTKRLVWDKRPLVYPLYINGNYLFGINLHWIRYNLRKSIIKWIYNNRENKKNLKAFPRVVYETIKRQRDEMPSLYAALRLYRINKIRDIKLIAIDSNQLLSVNINSFEMLKSQRLTPVKKPTLKTRVVKEQPKVKETISVKKPILRKASERQSKK